MSIAFLSSLAQDFIEDRNSRQTGRNKKLFLSSLAQDFIEDGRRNHRGKGHRRFLSSLAQDFIEDHILAFRHCIGA